MSLRRAYLTLLLLLACAATACRPNAVRATLVPNVPTQVFTEENVQVYNFRALDTSTTLRLRSNPANLPFLAEVRNQEGQLAATMSGGGALEDARVTIPANTGMYEVRVRTDAGIAGTVELVVTGQEAPTPLPKTESLTPTETVTAPQTAGLCRLTAPADVGVWREPSQTSEMFGSIRAGGTVNAEARAGDTHGETWFRLRSNDVVGWLPANSIQRTGACDTLPVVAGASAIGGPINVQATLTQAEAAPFDADSYTVTVDPNTGGEFVERVSYPNGDQIDRLWLSVAGLPAERPFTLQMACDGNAAQSLRWGPPDNPSLGCGGSLNTTFSPQITQRNLIVLMPAGGVAGQVRYRLDVTPAAPADAAQVLLPLGRDSGVQISEALSYPGGDTSDTYVVRVDGLERRAPHHARDFVMTMTCNGVNASSLRWGQTPTLGCGQSTVVRFSEGANPQAITVTLPEGSERGYVSYAISAVPLAPQDRERYVFSVDRNAGGQFGEVISAPTGDRTDVIEVVASNLTDSPPDNYREFQVALLCSGSGLEHVRWGTADNPTLTCNGATSVPMLITDNTRIFVVQVPEGAAYVHYNLVVQPILPTNTPPS